MFQKRPPINILSAADKISRSRNFRLRNAPAAAVRLFFPACILLAACALLTACSLIGDVPGAALSPSAAPVSENQTNSDFLYQLREKACADDAYADYKVLDAVYMNGDLYLSLSVDFSDQAHLLAWKERGSECSPKLKYKDLNYTTQYGIPAFDAAAWEGWCVFPQISLPTDEKELCLELVLGDISVPFSLTPGKTRETNYAYETSEKGGYIAISWLENGELFLDLYPFSNIEKATLPPSFDTVGIHFHPSLSPVLLCQDESIREGILVFSSAYFARWNFGAAVLGEYTLYLPALYFFSDTVVFDTLRFCLNMEQNTGGNLEYVFPDGTLTIADSKPLDLEPGAEFYGLTIQDMDYWLLEFYLEPKTAEFPFLCSFNVGKHPYFLNLVSMDYIDVDGDFCHFYVLLACMADESFDLSNCFMHFTNPSFLPLVWRHDFYIPIKV